MFSNIGKKIKTLAAVTCWFGIIASLITGIIFLCFEDLFVWGIIIICLPPFFWIGSFMTYGFGQLIENTDILVKLKKNENAPVATEVTDDPMCPTCGAKVNAEEKFCGSCGNPVK